MVKEIDQKKINEIIVDKDLFKEEWCKKHQQETREDIRSRRSSFFMEKWAEDFPEYDYINYYALLDLANRSDKVSRWFAEKDSEFNAILTFPEWAAAALKEEETVRIQDTFRNVNAANREIAELKRKLSIKMKELNKELDREHESRLAKAFNGSVEAFILTFPKNQLPIHLMLSIVQFNSDYRKSQEKDPDGNFGPYVTPSEYENNMLDAFRKKLWGLHFEGADIKEELSKMGVNFYIPTTFTAPGSLSNIKKILE